MSVHVCAHTQTHKHNTPSFPRQTITFLPQQTTGGTKSSPTGPPGLPSPQIGQAGVVSQCLCKGLGSLVSDLVAPHPAAEIRLLVDGTAQPLSATWLSPSLCHAAQLLYCTAQSASKCIGPLIPCKLGSSVHQFGSKFYEQSWSWLSRSLESEKYKHHGPRGACYQPSRKQQLPPAPCASLRVFYLFEGAPSHQTE